MAGDPKQVIEGEVVSALALQKELDNIHSELMHIEAFVKFVELSRAVEAKKKEMRDTIGAVYIPAYERGEVDKTFKGEHIDITVVENDEFDIDDKKLPEDYLVVVPNTKRIKNEFILTGDLPDGATHKKKYFIRLNFK